MNGETSWFLGDPIFEACARSFIGRKADWEVHGALLVKNGEVVSVGRNLRVNKKDLWKCQGYANHAEEMAIFTYELAGGNVEDGIVYVNGLLSDGTLFVHSDDKKRFTCPRCAKVLLAHRVLVAIPTESGWTILSPERALKTAEVFSQEAQNNFEGRKNETVSLNAEVVRGLRERIVVTPPEQTILKLEKAGFSVSPLAREILSRTEEGFLKGEDFREVVFNFLAADLRQG